MSLGIRHGQYGLSSIGGVRRPFGIQYSGRLYPLDLLTGPSISMFENSTRIAMARRKAHKEDPLSTW